MTNHTKPLVFCIGLVKTGTTSLMSALDILGWPGCDNIPLMAESWVKYANHVIDKPFTDLTDKYRAFSQNPVALRYAELYRAYPDAKFILTERDVNQAIASMLIHVAWNRLHPNPAPHMNWRNLNTFDDEVLYQSHGGNVRSFFNGRVGSLLIMDITKGTWHWPPLCKFLGVPVPAERFPHHNHSKGRLADMLSGHFSYTGKED